MSSVKPWAAIAVGGAMMAVGSLLSWADGDFLNSGYSLPGTEILEGNLTFVVGVVVSIIGVAAMRVRRRFWIRMAVLGPTLASLAIVTYVIATLAQRLAGWRGLSVGSGLWIVALGGMLAIVGAWRFSGARGKGY